MEQKNEINLEQIKASLTEMGIPYKDCQPQDNRLELIKSFQYEALPLVVDLTNFDNVDAEVGIIVRKEDQSADNGIYIFTVLKSGQAGFIVVEPSTITHAPLVRQVSGDIIGAILGIDLPPLTPFDMVEVMTHTLVGTFMRMLMESCRIPKEYHEPFLRIYLPKFLANMGLYFVGATKEDGTPMVYEEIANMEPMMVWRSIQKGVNEDEGEGAGSTDGAETTEHSAEEKSEEAQEAEADKEGDQAEAQTAES